MRETFTVVEKELTANEDFFFDPPVKIGEFQDRTLVLTNVGTRPIEITLIETDSENFSIPNSTGPFTIPAGGFKNLTVRFSPVERFDQFGMLTIATNANGGTITRAMNGFGLPSGYGLDPQTKTVGSEGGEYMVFVDSGGWAAIESPRMGFGGVRRGQPIFRCDGGGEHDRGGPGRPGHSRGVDPHR